MKITKFVHSCLLVETPERVALFDPGSFTTFTPDNVSRLDDILITHAHGDHMNVELIKRLRAKFPQVRITAPADAKAQLQQAGISDVSTDAPDGARIFDAPHESIKPLFMVEPPQEYGYHYLSMLTNPGDSHSFNETMTILAMPVQAPWGSTVAAAKTALELKPRCIVPIHDWHWNMEARQQMYDRLAQRFAQEGIMVIKPVDGVPVEINL